MNSICGVIIFLTLALVSLAQEPTPKAKQLRRVSWTPNVECMKTGFSETELTKAIVSCDSFIKDGATVKIIKLNDTILSVIIGDDGDYLIADTAVINNSENRLLVRPEHSTMFFWKDGDTKKQPEVSESIPGEKIAKKIRNRVAWANALGAIGAGMQQQSATVNSTTNGTVVSTGSNGTMATGTYTANTQSTITTQNTQAQVFEARRARDRTAEANSVGSTYIADGLKANTLFPKQSTYGMIYFKRTRAKFAIFTIQLGETLFDFAFTNPK